jgi:hypothetical protein
MATSSQHPLEQKIDRLIRRVRRANAIRAAALAGVVATVSLGVAGAVDMLVRSSERGSQTVLAALFVALSAAGLRWLWKPILRTRYDRVQIARRIEQAFPELRGVLASALEFASASADDPLAGSARLRALVVERATRLADPLDFAIVIDFRPARLALAALLAATLGAGMAAWCFPAGASLSARRILMPWSEQPWPRRHRLEFEQLPAKIAMGQDLQLTVVDVNGRAPQQVELLWRSSGELVEQRLWGEATADPARVRFRLERLARPLEVRASGGDDDTMDWHPIDVVEPPRLEALEVRVLSPDYIGEPPRVASQPVRGWAGSRLTLRGVASRPLQQASLRRLETLDGTAANSERERGPSREIPITLDSAGLALSLAADASTAWELRESAIFALEVTDRDGVTAEAARWVVQTVRDQPPTIVWRSPAAVAACAPNARVPILASVVDDLRVSGVELRYRIVGESETRSVELAPELSRRAANGPDRGKFELSWNWPLQSVAARTPGKEPLDPFMPGQVVEFWIAARDSLGQQTESPARRLEILAPEAVAERLAQREARLLEQLQGALLAQREAQAAAADAIGQAVDSPGMATNGSPIDGEAASPPDLERSQAAFLAQRLVRRKLEEPGGTGGQQAGETLDDSLGVREWLLGFAAEAQWSGGADDLLVQRLRAVADALETLLAGPLPTAERELQQTIRRRQERQSDWNEPLAAAQAAQAVAVAALEAIVERLAPWNQLRRHAEALGELREMLARDLAEMEQRLAGQASTGTVPEPDERELSERRRLAERQFESSRRLDRLLEGLEVGMESGHPDEAWRAAVGAAVEMARAGSLPSTVWEAGTSAQAGRWGAAADHQRTAVETVDAILDKLAGGRERSVSSRDAANEAATAEMTARREAAEAWRTAVEPWVTRQAAIIESLESLVERDDVARRTTAERLQRELAAEATRTASQLPTSAVFEFALTGAIRDMTRGADELRAVRIGTAFEAAQDALRRLERLVAALTEEATAPTMLDEPMAADEPPGEQGRRPPNGSLAELQLLRECQADLRNRTDALAESFPAPNDPLSDSARRQLDELAREQARLAELLEKLLP